MKIAALIKQVPDTETKIRIKADGSGIEESDIKYIVGPYDEFAIEEALQIKQKVGQAETYVISVGPERSVEAIRTALAMGIDKAVHIDNEAAVLDSYQTAKVLAGIIKKLGIDLVLCGKQAIDNDNSQVVSMLAEILDYPQVMIAEKIELNADKSGAMVTRRVSGAKEVYEVNFPLVVGCE
ncbi:MAG: electron transfer flavoprotein subunit beta, partial [uncultured bacterium]